jgi:hypothetical protein
MKKVLALCALALLAGCASAPAPTAQAPVQPTLVAGDPLGKDLHRTDTAVSEAAARDRAFAAHPD